MIGCIYNCGRVAERRGVCGAHLIQQKRDIDAGLTTDAELVRKGLRLPTKRQRNISYFRKRIL